MIKPKAPACTWIAYQVRKYTRSAKKVRVHQFSGSYVEFSVPHVETPQGLANDITLTQKFGVRTKAAWLDR